MPKRKRKRKQEPQAQDTPPAQKRQRQRPRKQSPSKKRRHANKTLTLPTVQEEESPRLPGAAPRVEFPQQLRKTPSKGILRSPCVSRSPALKRRISWSSSLEQVVGYALTKKAYDRTPLEQDLGAVNYYCDGCKKGLTGHDIRFHCLTCDDFDLCPDCCVDVGGKHDPEHEFALDGDPQAVEQFVATMGGQVQAEEESMEGIEEDGEDAELRAMLWPEPTSEDEQDPEGEMAVEVVDEDEEEDHEVEKKQEQELEEKQVRTEDEEDEDEDQRETTVEVVDSDDEDEEDPSTPQKTPMSALGRLRLPKALSPQLSPVPGHAASEPKDTRTPTPAVTVASPPHKKKVSALRQKQQNRKKKKKKKKKKKEEETSRASTGAVLNR